MLDNVRDRFRRWLWWHWGPVSITVASYERGEDLKFAAATIRMWLNMEMPRLMRQRVKKWWTRLYGLHRLPKVSTRCCWHWNPVGIVWDSHYCLIDNCIVLDRAFEDDSLGLDQVTINVLNHETLHWLLLRLQGWDVSNGFYDALNTINREPRYPFLSFEERQALGA